MGMSKTSGQNHWDELSIDFLPEALTRQCADLIDKYHSVHGYLRLPDMLWRSRHGPFIQRDAVLSALLAQASRARRAKQSNESFRKIAITILALEILASSFAGWSSLFPEAAERARILLRRDANNPQPPLLDYYVYPAEMSLLWLSQCLHHGSYEPQHQDTERNHSSDPGGGRGRPWTVAPRPGGRHNRRRAKLEMQPESRNAD